MDEHLKSELQALVTEVKSRSAAIAELEKKHDKTSKDVDEMKAHGEKLTALQRQVDAIDAQLAQVRPGPADVKSFRQIMEGDEDVQRLMSKKKGSFSIQMKGDHLAAFNEGRSLEQKTTIDRAAVGFVTTGVLPLDRTPGIVQEARQALTLRSVLAARPTVLGGIDYIKVNSAQAAASMQTESSSKVENALTFTAASVKVETIATIIPASRQVLDDMAELMGAIDNGLRYAVGQREEIELLFGNGNSPDLNGLYTQATAFDTSLLSLTPGWNKSDIISCAIQQIQIAKEIAPTFVVLHPTDYWQILRTKDANRNYMFGMNGMVDPFWGLTPLPTTFMSSGQFLVGSGNAVAAEIRDRMEMEVAVSTEHSTYFAENKVAIRAEKRLALVVYRPASFIKGTFNTSP